MRVTCVALFAALGLVACGSSEPASAPVSTAKDVVTEGYRVETAHYTIGSTATRAQTAQTGDAMEHLHAALPAEDRRNVSATPRAKLQLRLYGTRAEFKAFNRQPAWAEALYRQPECRAYVGDGPNPYHWMLHEGAHQLAREVAGFQRARWSVRSPRRRCPGA